MLLQPKNFTFDKTQLIKNSYRVLSFEGNKLKVIRVKTLVWQVEGN